MSVRTQLCNIVKDLKQEYKLTYDDIVTLGEGAYHKSQLVSVIKHNGNNVSVEVITDIIDALGCSVEVHTRNRSDLQRVKKRLETLVSKG